MSEDTITISREEYNELLRQAKELDSIDIAMDNDICRCSAAAIVKDMYGWES